MYFSVEKSEYLLHLLKGKKRLSQTWEAGEENL